MNLSPRAKSQIAAALMLVSVLLAGSLPVLQGLLAILGAVLGFVVFRARQHCPSCGTSLLTRRVAWLGGMTVYTPFAPRECPNCGRELTPCA
jgi:hypothetical protein